MQSVRTMTTELLSGAGVVQGTDINTLIPDALKTARANLTKLLAEHVYWRSMPESTSVSHSVCMNADSSYVVSVIVSMLVVLEVG